MYPGGLKLNQRTNGPVNAHLRPEIYTNTGCPKKMQPLLNNLCYFFNNTDKSMIFNTIVVLLYLLINLTSVLLGESSTRSDVIANL